MINVLKKGDKMAIELYDDHRLYIGLDNIFDRDFTCEGCKKRLLIHDEVQFKRTPPRAVADRVARCTDCKVMYRLEPTEYIVIKTDFGV